MSYNISNSGNTLNVTPFAHYRFDNLDTTMIGQSISAAVDASGNNRGLTTAHGVPPIIANNLHASLPESMTCIRLSGGVDSIGLHHQLTEQDKFSPQTTGLCLVLVYQPDYRHSPQPNYSNTCPLLTMDISSYQNNYSYHGINQYYQRITGRQYLPGRIADSAPYTGDFNDVTPTAVVLERTSYGANDTYGGPATTPGAYSLFGNILDWDLAVTRRDRTYHMTFHDLSDSESSYYAGTDYEWYQKPHGSVLYENINIGSFVNSSHHTSYNKAAAGRLYEAFVFDQVLSSTDRATMVQYIKEKYNVANSHVVDDQCINIPLGEELVIEPTGKSFAQSLEQGKREGTSVTVDMWVRFKGMRFHAPGTKYVTNFDTNTVSSKYYTVIKESAYPKIQSNTSYYSRTNLTGQIAQGHLTPQSGNRSYQVVYPVNNTWYNFKFVLTDYNDSRGTGYWKSTLFINGVQRQDTFQNTNYIYTHPRKLIFGIGETLGWPGKGTYDGYDQQNYERPTSGLGYSTPREQSRVDDDPTKRPNEFEMDIAGYQVTLNEFASAEEIQSIPRDTIYTVTSAYENIAMNARKLHHGNDIGIKPSDKPINTTTAPRISDQDLGGWQFMKSFYNPPAPLSVLGAKQWGATSSIWNGDLNLASRRIRGDLSFLDYSTASKSFKNTNIRLGYQEIDSLNGIDKLYNEETGSGKDTPTSPRHLYLESGRFKDLTPLQNSSFGKNAMINNLDLRSGELQTLDGISSIKKLYGHLYCFDNELTNIDDLNNTRWPYRTAGTSLYLNLIDFTPGVYPFEHFKGTGTISLYNNKITDIRWCSMSASDSIEFYSQGPTVWGTAIDGLDDLWIPQVHTINGSNNKYTVTSLNRTNIINRFNRMATLRFSNTNILDFSAIADLTTYERLNATDNQAIQYTGLVYDSNRLDYVYTDGTSSRDVASFGILEFDWNSCNPFLREPDEHFTDDLERTNGFTRAYNEGKSIAVVRHLKASYAPIHDLRLFRHSFMDGRYSWWSPNIGHHYAEFKHADMPSGPNTTGVMKNWVKINRVTLNNNRLTNLDDWFADTGFAAGSAAEDRSYWTGWRTYEQLSLSDNDISDLSFMLKTNFAAVKDLYLNNNPVTYEEVDRIADQLIALKANGDIALHTVHMFGTSWDNQYQGHSYGNWNNQSYYLSGHNDNYYRMVTDPTYENYLGFGLYTEKSRAAGWQGFKYEDGYTTEALLRKRLLDAGINFRFNYNSSNYVNGLGNTTTWPVDSNWGNYHVTQLNHYRWGHDNPDGRLIVTQSDTTENSSNNITITASIQVDMYPGDTITLSNLLDLPMSSNSAYPVGGTWGDVFGNSGEFDQTAGTLKLTVQTGKTMLHQQLYTLSFTITNPTYEEDRTTGHTRPGTSTKYKWTSGRNIRVDATDRLGVSRTDDFRYYLSEYVGPTTQ